jgi:hypothetical protein
MFQQSSYTKVARSWLVGLALFFLPALCAHACIFTYTLVGPDGSVRMSVESPTAVIVGESYRIEIAMREDHGNCQIEPEDTMFLLNESRWRLKRETQPLVLLSDIVWEKIGSTRYTTVIEFRVAQSGLSTVDVIRECSRGGYQGALVFEAA